MIKGFPPGSILWIKTEYPGEVINSLSPEIKKILSENYHAIIKTPEVQIDELDAQTLKAFGLKKIPKVISDPPLPSA